MRMKKFSLIVVLIFAGFVTNDGVVHADDHKHEDKKHEKYKEYKDYKDDDDDYYYDEEEEGETYYFQDAVSARGNWNIWTRTVAADKEVLPFTSSQGSFRLERKSREMASIRSKRMVKISIK